ncbi:MAG: phosphatidylglycerol lysyltransferase domain-containing protein [Thermodesulfobacteriota bacterium]
MRCFVHSGGDGRWLGAVTVSKTGPDAAHVETMLRSAQSPVGVMESLFVHVIGALGEGGYRELSLGEVPFVRSEGAADMPSLKERFLFGSGHFLKFAYDYKSLSGLRISSILPGGRYTCAGTAPFRSGRSRTCL